MITLHVKINSALLEGLISKTDINGDDIEQVLEHLLEVQVKRYIQFNPKRNVFGKILHRINKIFRKI